MKNGCKKKAIYSCDVEQFDKEHCGYFEGIYSEQFPALARHSNILNCEYYDSGGCTNPKARKHADGHGQKYPKPTEPCWQRYEFADGTRGMMEILSNSAGELFAFDMDHYPFGRPVDELDGTWGPRAPEWETDEENASMKSSAKTSS